jgi:hypothetical protein
MLPKLRWCYVENCFINLANLLQNTYLFDQVFFEERITLDFLNVINITEKWKGDFKLTIKQVNDIFTPAPIYSILHI